MFLPCTRIRCLQTENVCFATQTGQPNRSQTYYSSGALRNHIWDYLGANVVQAQTLQNWNWATLFGMCRCSKYVGTMVLVVSSPSQLLTAWPREDLSRPWKALVRSWLCRWWPWMSQPFCFESWFPHTEFWNDRTAFLVFLIEFWKKSNEIKNFEN